MVYLMCSLPSLSFGQVPPLSLEEFNIDAGNQLSVRQLNVLNRISIHGIEGKTGIGKLNSLAIMLGDVQSDIAEIRNAKKQNIQANISNLPRPVLSDNPLDREKQIMQWQWEELDTIEAGKTFTLTEVMVYKLKLEILHRLNSFDIDKGASVMASIVNPATNSKG